MAKKKKKKDKGFTVYLNRSARRRERVSDPPQRAPVHSSPHRRANPSAGAHGAQGSDGKPPPRPPSPQTPAR